MVKIRLLSLAFIFFVNLIQTDLLWAGKNSSKCIKDDNESDPAIHRTTTTTPTVSEDNNNQALATTNNQASSFFSIIPDEVFVIILDNLHLPTLSSFMRTNTELYKRIGTFLRYLSNEKAPRHYYLRSIIQDSQRSLDFEPDVASWKNLCSLSLQLISQPLFDLEPQQVGPTKKITQIKLLAPDIKTFLTTLISCIKPDTAFWYYLDALYRSWISDEENIEKFFEEIKSSGQSWGWGADKDLRLRLDDERFDSYQKSAEKGYRRAQSTYYHALLRGSFGEVWICDRKKVFGDLLAREKAGDEAVSHWINKALYYGKLDQDMRFADKRLQDLREREKLGDRDATIFINMALYRGYVHESKSLYPHNGSYFQTSKPEKLRFAELLAREATGDLDARKRVNKAIYKGDLGQDKLSESERLQKLQEREAQGDISARHYIDKVLYGGVLGMHEQPQEERLQRLRQREEEGDADARIWVNKTLLEGWLWPEMKTEIRCFYKLLEREETGDKDAGKRQQRPFLKAV